MDYLNVEDLKWMVKESLENAEQGRSKLPGEVEVLNGMSSQKIRRFLNNLCSYGPCKYLEIGVWSGSTLVPAMYDNDVQAVAIDNFSQFQEQNPREQLNGNLLKYGSHLKQYQIMERDCFDAFRNVHHKANVYFYDGDHGEHETRTAIEIYGKANAQPFILVVDDLDLTDSVRAGIGKALERFTVHDVWERRKDTGFHMGIFVAVLEAK